jgi:hypothetical protein
VVRSRYNVWLRLILVLYRNIARAQRIDRYSDMEANVGEGSDSLFLPLIEFHVLFNACEFRHVEVDTTKFFLNCSDDLDQSSRALRAHTRP